MTERTFEVYAIERLTAGDRVYVLRAPITGQSLHSTIPFLATAIAGKMERTREGSTCRVTFSMLAELSYVHTTDDGTLAQYRSPLTDDERVQLWNEVRARLASAKQSS